MPAERPTREELAACAEHFGFRVSDEDMDSFARLVENSLGSYDLVEELYTAQAPTPPAREYTFADPAANPYGAWYVHTEIHGEKTGPLAGKRVVIKDNINVAGLPLMNGSTAVEGYVPRADATAVTWLLEAGATIVGKAVCENLCLSGASHTSATGPVRNPWDPARTSGGSSSGCSALVANREVDLALGADQGGSIRVPGAFCGIVGHKPTHGLIPYTGAFPIESTLDHLGPITATVHDAALMLSVLAGRDGRDPRQPTVLEPQDYLGELDRDVAGLRVGVVAEGFGLPGLSDPDVDKIVRAAAARLGAAGLLVSEVQVPWHRNGLHLWNVIVTDGAAFQMLEGNGYGMNYDGAYDPELIAHYGANRVTRAQEFSDTVKNVAMLGRYSLTRMQGRHYAMARNLVDSLRAAYDEALERFDVLVMPTSPYPATPLVPPDADPETSVVRALGMAPNTAPFNVTGHPATTIPAGLTEGLPVGLMLIGRRFDDATPLRVAHAFENLVGGFPAPPDTGSGVA
ncbi:amidase [Amycolatopsis anabasis]|uniref:amidase n=1 Tax=Amycolatopsis anabasis TaxID=1840409 RepID=UPI00131CEC2A|nr:amidase [Amycolatopsis anabasis]